MWKINKSVWKYEKIVKNALSVRVFFLVCLLSVYWVDNRKTLVISIVLWLILAIILFQWEMGNVWLYVFDSLAKWLREIIKCSQGPLQNSCSGSDKILHKILYNAKILMSVFLLVKNLMSVFFLDLYCLLSHKFE